MSPDYSANANSQATPDYFLPQWMSSAPRLALPNQWPIEQFLSFLFCFTWFICLSAKKKSQTLSVKIIYGKPLCVRFTMYIVSTQLDFISHLSLMLCPLHVCLQKKKKKFFLWIRRPYDEWTVAVPRIMAIVFLCTLQASVVETDTIVNSEPTVRVLESGNTRQWWVNPTIWDVNETHTEYTTARHQYFKALIFGSYVLYMLLTLILTRYIRMSATVHAYT